MARFDFENILDEVKTVMTSNLNTKITAINAEKNDGITVPSVNANAYFMQSLDEKVTNFDPFIAYGIEGIETSSDYGRSVQSITMSCVIVLADNGRNNINRILYRYSRALREIFETNFQSIGIGNRFKINSLVPVPFEALDGSAQYKAIGILLETVLP